MMTNKEFAAWCESMVGSPYWFGTTVVKCTDDLLARKKAQYPKHYTDARMSRYKADIAAGKLCSDCVGACKGYAWNNGIPKSVAPDKTADMMFAYAKERGMDWGTIDTLPEIVGVAVRYDGHVGYYVGNGYAVEWRGFNYGCVRTKISARGWKHWYKLPWIDYEEYAKIVCEGIEAWKIGAAPRVTLGSRLLKRGCKGGDVRTLQEILIDMGYDLGTAGADGDFGTKTEAAVKKLQSRVGGLTQDGIYGEKTHAALMELVGADEPEDMPETRGRVRITGNTVNVRKGAGTQYGIITVAKLGQEFDVVDYSDTLGWFAVEVNGGVGWVSGKYAERV